MLAGLPGRADDGSRPALPGPVPVTGPDMVAMGHCPRGCPRRAPDVPDYARLPPPEAGAPFKPRYNKTVGRILGGIAGAVIGEAVADAPGAVAFGALGAVLGGSPPDPAQQKAYEKAARRAAREGRQLPVAVLVGVPLTDPTAGTGGALSGGAVAGGVIGPPHQ
ncbi:hypothetical protein [Yunchengibacter salinarum]|uniref:hypothetical protein n=1 Tax=Yunchengibacter salinarum TaxID=3133399 RepID=UPI0035B648EA